MLQAVQSTFVLQRISSLPIVAFKFQAMCAKVQGNCVVAS